MEIIPCSNKYFLTLVSLKNFHELSNDELCILLHSEPHHCSQVTLVRQIQFFGGYCGNNPHGQQLTSTCIQETTSWFHSHGNVTEITEGKKTHTNKTFYACFKPIIVANLLLLKLTVTVHTIGIYLFPSCNCQTALYERNYIIFEKLK
jgi:hypothetical protein